VATFDNKHVFVGLHYGFLHQICLESQTVIKDYGQIHEAHISTMVVTRNNIFLITGCYDGHLKMILIENQEVVKDFGKIGLDFITIIQLIPKDWSLFVYSSACNLKLIELRDGKTIKDYGNVYGDNVQPRVNSNQQMQVTEDGESLFTSAPNGGLKQWSVRHGTLVYEIRIAGICSMCV